MRNLIIQFAKLSLICTLIGCQRNTDPIKPDWFYGGWGEVDVMYNGGKWSNSAAAAVVIRNEFDSTCTGYLSVLLYKFSDAGYARQSLRLNGIPDQTIGRYPLVEGNSGTLVCGQGVVVASHSTVEDDGDVGKSYYLLDSSKDNYLDITSYDSTTRRISGTFQASFIKRAGFVNDDPATVKFENGRFSCPIYLKGKFE